MATADLRNEVLDEIFGVSAYSLGDAVWVSLHTADPGTDGSNEVSGNGYGRQNASYNAASSGSLDNSNQLDFDNMPATTVSHVGVWDSETAGDFLWGGSLDDPRSLNSGDTLRIEAGDLTASID